MQKAAIIISPNYKDYAKKFLADCLNSLRKQDYNGEIKFFITDNETDEESFNYLKEMAPEAEIIRNEKNDGYAKGNNDVMKKALDQGFDYIILFNMDTIVDANCISKMVEAAEIQPTSPPLSSQNGGQAGKQVGAVQARLMLWPKKDKINSLGNITHFLGFGYSQGNGVEIKNWSDSHRSEIKNNEICYPSGAAVLFKAEVLNKVGLFDEEYWMYNEDQDLGWRIWLAGYKCVLAAEAVVYHKYEFSRSIRQYYWLDRNRIISMIKNYHPTTLLLISPAFIIMEIGMLFYAIVKKKEWLNEKLKVYNYFLTKKNWDYLFRARAQSQKIRQAKEQDIIKMFSGVIDFQEINNIFLKIANPIFNLYWQIVKFIVIW